MAVYPYIIQRAVVIGAAGGVGAAQIPVATQQKVTINTIVYTSTGVWGFYEISNSNGRKYTDATQAIPIPSTTFQMGGSPNIGVLKLPFDIELEGNDILNFMLINTSAGANTIQLSFLGQISTG